MLSTWSELNALGSEYLFIPARDHMIAAHFGTFGTTIAS
jgi:hypothetical protein